jgi:hypothetical protein
MNKPVNDIIIKNRGLYHMFIRKSFPKEYCNL